MAGALIAVQRRVPYDLGAADFMVGTSAGSVLAAALRCGISPEDIVRHQRGIAVAGLPALHELDRNSTGPLPPLPRLRMGSPELLLRSALAPYRVHPAVAASALLPIGRAAHTSLHALVRGLLVHAGSLDREHLPPPRPLPTTPDWAGGGETWVMAVDYQSGQRVAFGRFGAPRATLPDAVVASCSIPGWHQPALISGRRYIDGGVRSSTSLDLLAGAGLDEVYVLAPMASFVMDAPQDPYARLERRFRRLVTAGLRWEARRVRAQGTRVIVLTPGREDLAVMGANLMDPSRRRIVLETSLRTSPTVLAWLERCPRAS
jgi:NTE family protein